MTAEFKVEIPWRRGDLRIEWSRSREAHWKTWTLPKLNRAADGLGWRWFWYWGRYTLNADWLPPFDKLR